MTEADPLVRTERAKHRTAVIQVVTWTVMVVSWIVATILVLQRFGLPLSGLVAPASVAGVAVGFGAQRVIQDLLAGFFIVLERQYGFGDVIRVSAPGTTSGVTGTVEEVTLRVTRLRTIDGELLIIPNGQILQVTNLSRDWARAVIDIPVAAGTDLAEVTERLRQAGDEACADEGLKALMLDAPSVMGVESMSVDQYTVRMVARTLPGRQFEVARALRARVTAAFRDAGIVMPAAPATAAAEATAG
jgi:small conductance mechanosensitive channel